MSETSRPGVTRWGAISPFVFLPAAAITTAVVGLTVSIPKKCDRFFGGVTDWIVGELGWLFTLVVTFALVVVLIIPWGRRGAIRLGPPDSRPNYSTASWFAMLFSAGMGIGLLFFGVAEPILHFANPPFGSPETQEAARRAMGATFFHWGFHAWGIYVLLGLALGYFAFRKGLPLSVRSVFHPLIGDRIYGRWGDLVDLFAVFGTLFGLATSLGLGASQIGSGLELLLGWNNTLNLQLAVIGCVTVAATASLVSGVDRGIRRLSELTLILAACLLVFVAVFGQRSGGISILLPDLVAYGRQALAATIFSPEAGAAEWRSGWTIFYWAWWIAWAPFVSTFIARVSRGRTVRQFVFGVLLLPTGLTVAWLFVFGETALFLERSHQNSLSERIEADTALSLYALLEQLPWPALTCAVGAVTVVLFFVTSSDSGSFVVDMLTSGGHPNPPLWQRIFWALAEGAVAGTLLWGGGLQALQNAAIATGLPFAIVLLFVGASLLKALFQESRTDTSTEAQSQTEAILPRETE